jgi:hypothetical protein
MFNYYVLELIWLVIIIIILIYIYIYIYIYCWYFKYILLHFQNNCPGFGWTRLNWGSLESESPTFPVDVQLGISEARNTCISGSAYARFSWARVHFEVSTCTHIHTHQHVYTSRWVCAHLQVGMCTLTLQHVCLDLSQLHWSYS